MQRINLRITLAVTIGCLTAALVAQLIINGVSQPRAARHYALNYYVSPSGSDSNDGLSASAPWRTIQKTVRGTISPSSSTLPI